MKIVSWNCNAGFAQKYTLLDQYEADILIIQECADPAQSSAAYRDWAGSYVWKGTSKHKGIGIFARTGQTLAALDWSRSCFIPQTKSQRTTCYTTDLNVFLPCQVNDAITLVGVWTKLDPIWHYHYVGQALLFTKMHAPDLTNPKTIVCGDFNSNCFWDRPRRRLKHSDLVDQFAQLGLQSIYHIESGEAQGAETRPTHYHQKNVAKPYHIDYCFLSNDLVPDSSIQILAPATWLKHSDHVPLVCEITGL